MHKSKYPIGTVLRVSIQNPLEFSPDDIKRYIQLSKKDYFIRTAIENAELKSIRRNIAHKIGLSDLDPTQLEIDGNTLVMTIH